MAVNISSVPRGNNKLISPEGWRYYMIKNKMLSFSFARHPFERLVSAYKDKVLKIDKFLRMNWFQKVYSYVYRNWYKKNNSFPSFVDLILNKYKNMKISNIHWESITNNCNYCDIEYDVIGRMETFNDDVKYIFQKNHLEKDLPLSMVTVSKNAAKLKTSNVTAEYFSQLSKDQITDLYKYYRLDFELFGYDVSSYISNNTL